MIQRLYAIVATAALIMASSVTLAESPTAVEGATTIDVATAKQLFDRGVPFVDVRGGSYHRGHIPGAVHLELYGDFTQARLSEIVDKDREVVIYCGGPT